MSERHGDIDFASVQAAGFRFCICKASEGADQQDARWVANLRRIRELDAGSRFYPGAYHLARLDLHRGRRGGETEARWFCQVLQHATDSLGLSLTHGFIEPVLALETWDKSEEGDAVAWIEGFLSVVASELGRTGMIKVAPNYWRDQVADVDTFAKAGIPLWVVELAERGADPSQSPPRMPTDPRRPQWDASLWQWSGDGDFAHRGAHSGPIPGIAGGIASVDRIVGDELVLARLAAASSDPRA